MKFDQDKLTRLREQQLNPAGTAGLYRQKEVLQVAVDVPVRSTLEAVLEMEEGRPVELFRFDFSDSAFFLQGEKLVSQLKKNFCGYLFGAFADPLEPALIDRAYAAGLDLIQLPLTEDDPRQWVALNYARTVFPAWSVIALLPVSSPGQSLLKILLQRGIIPLVDLQDVSPEVPDSVVETAFKRLSHSWQHYNASLSPLYPLLELTTPLVPPPRAHGLGGLLKRIDDVRQRTGLDLRRLLRVRGVADSFDSAGL